MAWVRLGESASEPPAIEPAWIAERLSERGYAPGFDDIELEHVGRFSSDVWRLRLLGGGSGGAPPATARPPAPRLIAKVAHQAPRTGESLDLEATFYERMADALPIRTPRFVGRIADGLVIAEVDGLQPFDFQAGALPAHGPGAMDALAALHAATWEESADLEWVPEVGDPKLRAAWQADFDTGWHAGRERFDALCPAFTPIGDALVGTLGAAIVPLATPRVLLHGDAHGENLPLDAAGHVVFLDWESPRVGNPAFDVAVFTTMSYPVRQRRKVEQELVERHLRALGPRSVGWKDPWRDYRLAVLRRAARIVEIGAQGSFPSLDWVFTRCATAAVDHHVLDLID
jgi:hypothetical protein